MLFFLQINVIIHTHTHTHTHTHSTENIQLTFNDQFASISVILFDNIPCLALIILRLVYSIIVSNGFIGMKDFIVPAGGGFCLLKLICWILMLKATPIITEACINPLKST